MKKYILIFIATLLPLTCLAGSIQDMHRAVIARKAVSDPCSDTSPGDPGDILCESFENEADGLVDASWDLTTDDEGAGCVISVKQAHSGDFGCSTRGRYYLDIDTDDAIECAARNPVPASEDPSYYAFSIKVVDHGLSAGQDDYVFQNSVLKWGIRIMNDAGTLKWSLYHRDKTDAIEFDNGTNITLGTWYRHRLKIDADCGTAGQGDIHDCIQWWIAEDDGVLSEQAISDDSTNANQTTSILQIGDGRPDPEDAIHIHVDNVLLDDDDTGLDTCN